ncbi:MAG: DUF4258 domain-containing protein [Deltaproteobacteria bacterium]|nr:DUF4258 domain-containing protein [Deltaproteobacteria bacterium]
MTESEILKFIKGKVKSNFYQAKLHAIERMNERGIMPEDIKTALLDGRLVENYPDDKRGHSCLVWGRTNTGRDLHIVCGISEEYLWIITIYEPDKEEWETPERRKIK